MPHYSVLSLVSSSFSLFLTLSLTVEECSQCKLCVDACKPGAIHLTPVLDSFVVSIESCGSIPAKDLVAMAFEEIKKRAEDLDAMLAEVAKPGDRLKIMPI